MQNDRLVHMANQIARFFVTQPGGKAAEAIANHLVKFWDPRMRDAIIAYAKSGGEGLDPPAAAAINLLSSAQG